MKKSNLILITCVFVKIVIYNFLFNNILRNKKESNLISMICNQMSETICNIFLFKDNLTHIYMIYNYIFL